MYQTTQAMEANMKQSKMNRQSLTESARELRREALSNLLNNAFAGITDALRNHHEAWLRRNAMRTPRMKSVIGTPA